MSSSSPDLDLLRAWRAGDRLAGQALVRAHQPKVARYLYLKLGPEAGREVVQETFLALCKNPERYRGEVPFDRYLFGVARRKMLEYRRRVAVRLTRETTSKGESGTCHRSPEQQALTRFADNVVVQALRRLPSDDQVLLELHDHAGLKRHELAVIFEVPPGTVASRLDRARKRLVQAAELLQSEPSEFASTHTSLATYWLQLHRQWSEEHQDLDGVERL